MPDTKIGERECNMLLQETGINMINMVTEESQG